MTLTPERLKELRDGVEFWKKKGSEDARFSPYVNLKLDDIAALLAEIRALEEK